MKRSFLFLAFAALLTLPCISQTQKGWQSVGGTGRLSFGFDPPQFQFALSPELYWFVADDFAIGMDFGFGYGSIKVNDSTSSHGYNALVAPGARYYFRDVEKKWRPYVFLNVGFETYANKYKVGTTTIKTDGNGVMGYAGGGMAWFFTEHAAFDIRLHLVDYAQEQAKVNPTFSIGIQAFFD